jgi:hypothetical protein
MQSLSIELTIATGATRFPRNWDATDVPAVSPRDLAVALRCCMSFGGIGRGAGFAVLCEINDEMEQRVLAMFSSDPARSLAVLLRLRSIVSALQSRRFRSIAEGRDPTGMLRLIVAASSLRLNAARGLSPVRLVWACATGASEGDMSDKTYTAVAA